MPLSGEEGMPVFCSVPGFYSMNVVFRKVLTLSLAGMLATAGFAQQPTQPATQPTQPSGSSLAAASAPNAVTEAELPLPQAPKPQGNEYQFYSDQNYARGQSQWPKFWSVWGVRSVAPPNFTNSSLIDRVIRD